MLVMLNTLQRSLMNPMEDSEVLRLAGELVEATGESLADGIRQALRERLLPIRRNRSTRATAAELIEIGKHCAVNLKQQINDSVDHTSILFDDRGAPK